MNPVKPIEIVIATANLGKVREFQEILGAESGAIRWLAAGAISSPPEVEETGKTFRANACLKASAFARHYKRWALADDSGLEIDALHGSPGVYSGRWAEMNNAGNGDPDNNRLVLRQLREIPDDRRAARFLCVLALSDPEGRIAITSRGTLEGSILHEPRGTGGFGYDSLLLVESMGKTTAELNSGQKHAISHRGNALRRLRDILDEQKIFA